MKKQAILVSSCLLGVCCRYDGASKPNGDVIKLREKYVLIPICPEVDGGLPTPRTPSERVGDRVLMRDGTDVTVNYQNGAEMALERARSFGCTAAVLKARSPSCGKGVIYDGSFSGRLTDRDGVAAELLRSNGIEVYTEEEIHILLEK
ncbi:MAG: DUF523 domain-containing protein [Clostridia bacterium]|nr:DUF523 domain-containing protein [Clostridia bacterium]